MDFRALTGYLDSVPSFGAPGVDCMITMDYKPVYRHMSGFSDRERGIEMQGNELFYVYSVTKLFTCTAVMQLYEKGLLGLEDPVSEYLPEFSSMQELSRCADGTVQLRTAKNPITVTHLLTMTAGLDYDLGAPEILQAIAANPNLTTRDIVRAIASRPLNFEPGTRWSYSLCHDVLGALIEVVSGLNFGEYLKKYIFEPLDITRTGFDRSPEIMSMMMKQYLYDDSSGKVSLGTLNNPYTISDCYQSGGAGLISCVEDCSRFGTALANGGLTAGGERIIAPSTIELMRTNRLSQEKGISIPWEHMTGYGYGLGVRTMVDRAAAGSLGPVGEFGWAGAAGCYMLIDPDEKLCLFYAQQMLPSLEPVVHPRLRNLLYSPEMSGNAQPAFPKKPI